MLLRKVSFHGSLLGREGVDEEKAEEGMVALFLTSTSIIRRDANEAARPVINVKGETWGRSVFQPAPCDGQHAPSSHVPVLQTALGDPSWPSVFD